MLPHYSFVVIVTEAQHYPPNPKLSNHIHAFTILWTMLKISVQILLLPVLHLQNSFKCLKTKSHFKTMFFHPLLPKKALLQEKQNPTNEEQLRSSQLGCFWFSFPCSFVRLLNWILQITLARDKVHCMFITWFYILSQGCHLQTYDASFSVKTLHSAVSNGWICHLTDKAEDKTKIEKKKFC